MIDIAAYDANRILKLADSFLLSNPITITASSCSRSAGGLHDFYSEGDYWWPDPKGSHMPYVRRDGLSNPENFSDHRLLLMQMSIEVSALITAWTISADSRYAIHAMKHLIAWFVDKRTYMHPSLEFAQAVQGRATGRGIGIVDTIHLIEVALAVEALTFCASVSCVYINQIRVWFAAYLKWLTTHPYGKEERNQKNNHATCWVAQVAAFAKLAGDEQLIDECSRRFRAVLIPGQMALDGSFPLELARTKPYNYSLFNLEMMAVICQLLSTSTNSLWDFELLDGRGIRKALEFMAPYVEHKQKWPFHRDVMYFDEWPKRHSSLLFGGIALQIPELVDLWMTLEAESEVPEVIRNFFVRQPVLWLYLTTKHKLQPLRL